MKIAVDGRCLTSKPDGVANFTINAINSISKLPDYIVFIFAHKEINKEVLNKLSLNSNVNIVITPCIFFNKIGLLWFISRLPNLIRKYKIDIIWGPAQVLPFFLGKVKKMITIHDFVFKYYGKTMSWGSRIENFIFTSFSIKSADFLWCVSNYTKEELIKLYNKRKCSKIFVGSGINNEDFKYIEYYKKKENKELVLKKYGISGTTIICVGTIEPRKNINHLLKIANEFKKHQLSILIIGNKGWGNLDFIDPELSIKFTGYISLDELISLYNVSDLLINTSFNEGFGLPLLEAMSCGCPVVCPHNSAMIEIVDGAGYTVKGWHIEDWVEALEKVLNNREYYVQNSLDRVKIYNWKDISSNLNKYIKDQTIYT